MARHAGNAQPKRHGGVDQFAHMALGRHREPASARQFGTASAKVYERILERCVDSAGVGTELAVS